MISDMNKYYIYVLVNTENDRLIFIGKSIESTLDFHMEQKDKEIAAHLLIPVNNIKKIIIKEGLSENEAVLIEESIISLIKIMNNNLLFKVKDGIIISANEEVKLTYKKCEDNFNINSETVNKFACFCEENFNLNNERYSNLYKSLSVCILDCIYSLRAKYFSVTVPVVERYASKFMNYDRFSEGDTLENFMKNIDSFGNSVYMVEKLLLNKQKIGKRLKIDICYELASKLLELGINNIEDFRNYESTENLEKVILSVKGVGNAALNYLFMLAGDPDRCKPDVHIKNCIKDATGLDMTDQQCQYLFKECVILLKKKYQNLTVSLLDSIIWQKYQSR